MPPVDDRYTQRTEEYILEREADPESAVNQLMRMDFNRYQAWTLFQQQQILSQLMDLEDVIREKLGS